eukprot:TRINITY_DN33265_c0_g1_i1.p1 TRINITY_DN33265_c0_g1~~TRINITY_DN33265_c0_g1_i1.p1  ORF type:complete len:631 (+),score=231.24 TRINITY_DN33265_c0_g1_i1:77-1894(+)
MAARRGDAAGGRARRRRKPGAEEKHDSVCVQLRQLFPDDEGGVAETSTEQVVKDFQAYAGKRGFRNDPKQAQLTAHELAGHVDVIRQHLVNQRSSREHVVRVVHAFLMATRCVQAGFRRYLRRKEAVVAALLCKWEAVEQRARASISKEISIKQFDYENVGAVRVVGGTRVHALKGLHNDCWTSVDLKCGAIGALWHVRRRQYRGDLKAYLRKEAARARKAGVYTVDGIHDTDLELQYEKDKAARVAQKAEDFKAAFNGPCFFRDYVAPGAIDVFEIVDCLELYLINKRLGGRMPPPASPSAQRAPRRGGSGTDNQWVVYYAGLLAFRSKNVNALIEKGFQLTGKMGGGQTSPERARGEPPARRRSARSPHRRRASLPTPATARAPSPRDGAGTATAPPQPIIANPLPKSAAKAWRLASRGAGEEPPWQLKSARPPSAASTYGRRRRQERKGPASPVCQKQDAMCGTDDLAFEEGHAVTPLPAQLDARRRAREHRPYVGKEFFHSLLPKPPSKPKVRPFVDGALQRMFPDPSMAQAARYTPRPFTPVGTPEVRVITPGSYRTPYTDRQGGAAPAHDASGLVASGRKYRRPSGCGASMRVPADRDV